MAKLSILAPLVYIAVLVGSLAVFSSLYRKRKANRAASLEPWFPTHTARDVYLTLLHMDPPVPASLLKAALLRRATEDIHRIITIRSAKQALAQLLQRGSIGDDLWTRFTAAEKEIEEELRDVVMEANAFKQDWGATIFQSANEMLLNEKLRERAAEVTTQAANERAWWDEKRERVQRELLSSASDSPATSSATPATSGIGSARSEEEALVADEEKTPSPAATAGGLRPGTPSKAAARPQTPTTPGGRKKGKRGTPKR
ncbi:Pre protein translocase subunit Sec66-domain-containing protein [Terfezia claveryi]|nr:Pre protein translocase subunit Sec66-domain-containing protein [Terfezia claveryi]